MDCRNAQGQVAARTRGSRNNVQIPGEEREQHVENRATALPRHRRPCQCTAPTTTRKKKALWVPVSVQNRGKHNELNLRHHPGSKQDCRTCRCMIHHRRRLPATACHRLPLLDGVRQAIPVTAGPNAAATLGTAQSSTISTPASSSASTGPARRHCP